MAKDLDACDAELTVALELAAGVYTDGTADVRRADPVRWSYGIAGSTPTARVASSGSCTLTLSNHAGGDLAAGRWSPDHRNCTPGFDVGIGIRIGLSYGGATTYKKYYLEAIQPTAGDHGVRATLITGVDLLDAYARFRLRGLTVQTNKRSDQLFTLIYGAVTKQPDRTAIGTGQDTYAYAFDNLQEEKTAMAAFQQLALSELGYIAVKRDGVSGETLVFEDRHSRTKTATNAYTFRGDTDQLTLSRNRSAIYNVVGVTAHPRRLDTSDVVLWDQGDAVPKIEAGQTLKPFGPFRDPDQEAARVGGTSMITPAATTDFLLNTAADGSGSNVTASCTVAAVFNATGVRWTITNNTAADAYVTKLQCRGRGLYDYAQAHMEASDTDSMTTYGERAMSFDMPYQDDQRVAQRVADYILGMHKDPVTTIQEISYIANRNPDLMDAAISLDVSDRIGIQENQTGVDDVVAGTSTRGHFINAVNFERGDVLRVGYTLVPSDAVSFWILENAGASVMDITTRCGYL